MARRTTPKEEPKEAPTADFDDLLAEAEPAAETTVHEVEAAEPATARVVEQTPPSDVLDTKDMTPGQRKIAELQAQLRQAQEAARKAEAEAAQPEEEDDGLTDEERAQIKAMEDELAKTNARAIANAPVRYDNSQRGGTGEKILIHIVRDGFTAFGQVWLRGQEIEIEVGTPAYERTKNTLGVSWLDMRHDPAAQYAAYKGKQYFADGPFVPIPGEKFDDEVARADQRRNRSVPVLAV